jgi:hypothetical protein
MSQVSVHQAAVMRKVEANRDLATALRASILPRAVGVDFAGVRIDLDAKEIPR